MDRACWIVGLTLFAGFATSTNATADPQERLRVKVLVHDEVGISAKILEEARREATRIFADAGIDLWWATQGVTKSRYVIIKIVPKTTSKMSRDFRVMGLAAGAKDGKGTLAYVFYDRIRDNGRGVNLPVPVIMGHVIAHEMGHLLLSYGSHSVAGLMKGGWDAQQSQRAMEHDLRFSRDEIVRIKSRLAAQP